MSLASSDCLFVSVAQCWRSHAHHEHGEAHQNSAYHSEPAGRSAGLPGKFCAGDGEPEALKQHRFNPSYLVWCIYCLVWTCVRRPTLMSWLTVWLTLPSCCSSKTPSVCLLPIMRALSTCWVRVIHHPHSGVQPTLGVCFRALHLSLCNSLAIDV